MATKIGKIITLVFLLYLIWFKEAYSTVDAVLYGCVISLTFLVGIDLFKSKDAGANAISSIVRTFFILAVYSFLSGFLIASNIDVFINRLVRLIIFSVLCLDCEYICKKEKSSDWLFNIFTVCAAFCAVQTILKGVSYNGASIITMSHNNNPNKLGLTMVFGVASILYNFDRYEKHRIVSFALLLSFVYVTMLSASRKSFISIVLLFTVWIKDYLQSSFNSGSALKKVTSVLATCGFVAIAVLLIIHNSESTSLFLRLSRLGTTQDSERRIQLYREAIDMWKSSPIFGVGYSQFQEHNSIMRGYYSHSTYAELLSCTGSIGFLIFFIPIIKKVYQTVLLLLHPPKNLNKSLIYKNQMILLIFVVELFLATGQIIIYEIDHMLILTLLFIEVDSITNVAANKQEKDM